MEQDAAGARGATLLVRHLPDYVPPETLKRLFAHYGASDLRACMVGRLKNCAFLDFPDAAVAARAQTQLNRLRFLGKTLTVERARNVEETKQRAPPLGASKFFPPHSHGTGPKPVPGTMEPEPIAPSLGVNYPFPPHLEYVYPPPDGNILSNIVNALIAVPKFYTQVLHLMNKMNLPAPFRPAKPTPPLPRATGAREREDIASDESELESSGDEEPDSKSRKRRRKEAIVGPALAKDASHEAAGVKTLVDPSRAIPSIKRKQPVLQIKIASKPEEKPRADNAQVEQEKHEEVSQQRRFATREELESGKLPQTEVPHYPVFKNYTPGDPSPVLYIKNLEKDVVPEDIYYVFGGFFPSFEEAQSGLDVKLMQEGRMRGQAFVRFPSPELAGEALVGVHSFVLKGKPMVIQFGRNK